MASSVRELALEGVSRALFGADTGEHLAALAAASAAFEATTGAVLRSPLVLILNQLPGAWRAQFRRRATVLDAAREFDRVVDEILVRRAGEREPGEDLLAQLLAGRDEVTGEPLSRKEIRDEVTGYPIAAQDTTGLTLTWVWYLPATRPEAREKLEAEVDEVVGDRLPTVCRGRGW